ncbi:MAG: nucleotidyltransferase [Oscillospiraceae bacterium]|nr:nucleotidyltransferase [Oscillospiraceae bacterium]
MEIFMNEFKITGIVTEYNPFHSGHAYQLSQIHSDAVVAVMSGSFVQRGDVALSDKWTRAKYAVMGGVDLVVELPAVFALNTAQKFALGAVSLLDGMGVDEICFGSESGDIEALRRAAELMENEPHSTSEKVKDFISSGMSYPTALEKAYAGTLPDNLLSSPNNILGIEYLRALIQLGSSITPTTVKRIGAGYNDSVPRDGIACASAIREILKRGGSADDFTEFKGIPNDLSRLDSAVIANLRMMTPDELKRINDVSEGLENRILRAAQECDSIESAAEKIKTKRYTMSRIKRILISSLLGFTSDMSGHLPDYIRVLAMNGNGKKALKELKRRSNLPVITKAADYKTENLLFDMDIRATNIAALCEASDRRSGKDFLTSPIIIDNK